MLTAFCVALAVALPMPAQAEQVERFGELDVHYVVVPTLYLLPQVADEYGITRARDRAFLNVALVEGGHPVRGHVTGAMRNLLGQVTALEFTEIEEGDAVYYLAPVRHTDREILRFSIDVTTADQQETDGQSATVEFQQTLYWQD